MVEFAADHALSRIGNGLGGNARVNAIPRISRLLAACAACLCLWPSEAPAQSRLEGRYGVTLAGVPLGKGAWVVDIAEDQFTAAASGRVTGVMRVVSSGEGAAASRGAIVSGRLVPNTFAVNVTAGDKTDDIRFSLQKDGSVRDLVAEPAWPPHPLRVPVTEANKRGVLDPMTAGLVLLGGAGDVLAPEVCNRTLPVFDGRQRYDLALSFKRMDRVKAEKGYQGPVVVCTVAYRPVSGHRPDRSAVKFLTETRDIEIWYAPITGTRVLAPFRISVPTFLGSAVLQASHFVSSPLPPRPTPAKTN